jgi:hypothetical protein
MAEIFLALSGRLANAIVAFYLEHQHVLNAIVLGYGLILMAAHRNLRRAEAVLTARYESDDWSELLGRLASDPGSEIDEQVSRAVRAGVIASPYFFSLYRLNRRNLISVLGKKNTVPRGRLAELDAIIIARNAG